MTTIAVVDHGAGNLVSIGQGLERAGARVTVATAPDELRAVDGVVLPGVGATGAAMARLTAAGLTEPLVSYGGPLLGICVGLQLFFESSAEDGGQCLGVIPGSVQRLQNTPRLPHIGWNDVTIVRSDSIFDGIASGTPFYFVHSYAPVPSDPSLVIGTTNYGGPVVAAVRAGNRVGVQFHPERSGPDGLRVLSNFVRSCRGARHAA